MKMRPTVKLVGGDVTEMVQMVHMVKRYRDRYRLIHIDTEIDTDGYR